MTHNMTKQYSNPTREEGRAAYALGLSIDDNPYNGSDDASMIDCRSLWQSGYLNAMLKSTMQNGDHS